MKILKIIKIQALQKKTKFKNLIKIINNFYLVEE